MTSQIGKIRGLFWEILQEKGMRNGKKPKKIRHGIPYPLSNYIWFHLGFRICSAETYYHASGQSNRETRKSSLVCFNQGLMKTCRGLLQY